MCLTLADALAAGCDSSSPAGKMGETGGASAGESLEREDFCSVAEASLSSYFHCCWHRLMGRGG